MSNQQPNLKLIPPSQQQETLAGLIFDLIQSAQVDPRSQQIIEDTLIFVRDSMVKMLHQPLPPITKQ